LKSTILITGGTGYIGSHAAIELMQAGCNVVVLDDLCNNDLGVIEQMDKRPTFNLGTGSGVSVLQLVDAVKQATGMEIPYQIFSRRPGDVASCYAATDLALEALSWSALLPIEVMCADAWRWEQSIKNAVDHD